jgi:hypothetical protein
MQFGSDVTDRKKLACANPTYTCGQNKCVTNYDTLLRIKRACIINSSSSYVLEGIPIVSDGGSGYAVGNTIQLVGGTPTSTPIVLEVTEVGESGNIVTVAVVSALPYSIPPTSPTQTIPLTGEGSDATFTATFILDPTLCVICAPR